MKEAAQIAKELIESGKIKRLECGMLDVHIDLLAEYAGKYKMEKYELLDAVLEYEHDYTQRSKFN